MAKKNKFQSDNNVSNFVKLPKDLTRSTAFKLLSGSEAKVFTLLISQYNGKNNGNLTLVYNKAEEYNLSRQTLSKALYLLEAKGFIQCVRRGHNGAISLYAVTCFGIDDCLNNYGVSVHQATANHIPSNQWGKYDKQLKAEIQANGGKHDKAFFIKHNKKLLSSFSKI